MNADVLALCSYQHDFVILGGKGVVYGGSEFHQNNLQTSPVELAELVTSQMVRGGLFSHRTPKLSRECFGFKLYIFSYIYGCNDWIIIMPV